MAVYSQESEKSRRDFLKTMLLLGTLGPLSYRSIRANTGRTQENGPQLPKLIYKYRTLSVDHLPELEEEIDEIKKSGQLSDNKTFRSYIDNKKYQIPEDFPEAKSIIVMATFTKLMFVNFYHKGKKVDVMIPPQYYDDGHTFEQIEDTIQKEIIQEPGYRLQRKTNLLLKRLAVHSGLARYGRNNIAFVDEFGSYLTLYAFFTDYQFSEDHWTEVKMLDNCKPCRICIKQCPTQCITMKKFVIDAGKCVTLYNEAQGEFPNWMPRDSHNALMGCMLCQLHCPANHEAYKKAERMEDITEEETQAILDENPDDETLKILQRKLRGYYPATSMEYFPILTRNLTAVLNSNFKLT